jgi:hypothetical protein
MSKSVICIYHYVYVLKFILVVVFIFERQAQLTASTKFHGLCFVCVCIYVCVCYYTDIIGFSQTCMSIIDELHAYMTEYEVCGQSSVRSVRTCSTNILQISGNLLHII